MYGSIIILKRSLKDRIILQNKANLKLNFTSEVIHGFKNKKAASF